jgi:D-inositol-3-phosphate glycosyltransferase
MTTERIAVLAYHSSPLREPGSGDSGGMTIYVRALADALSRRGVRTDIFTRALDGVPQVTVLGDLVRVISIEAGPRSDVPKEELPGYLESFAAGVSRFTNDHGFRYDIIHSHYWQSGLAGLALAAEWDIPLVHSHHTLGLVKNRLLAPGDSPEPEVRLEGEARVIGGADVLIASTDDEWQQLACMYGASHDRLKTMHPGVDHRAFTPGDKAAARAGLGLGEERILLYAGRIQPLKGLELAVRATEQLIPALEGNVKLMVVGGASGASGEQEMQHLLGLIEKLGIEDHVRFVPPQPHVRLVDFYRAADVLVMCSFSESFGLAALEAQSCGIPVVSTAVSGLSYIVRDEVTGFLVDSRDPSAFAGKLKTVLSDRDLHASFAANAIKGAERFSWEKTAASMLELYDCLILERAPEACVC